MMCCEYGTYGLINIIVNYCKKSFVKLGHCAFITNHLTLLRSKLERLSLFVTSTQVKYLHARLGACPGGRD